MRVDEHTIELDGSPIFYRTGGESPTPLYLHSAPTGSEDWIPFLERTGGIAPDLIGFGRSAKGGHLDYSIGGLARVVDRLLTVLGADRVQLVGHGWGAAVGVALGSRVERAVLIDPLPLVPGFEWPRMARLWRRRGVGELVMGATSRGVLARWLRSGGGRWSPSVWEQFDQGTQRAILRLHRSVSAEPGMQALDAPAHVIWGQDDPWFPAALAPAYASALGQATVEVVAGARHWPWLDDPGVIDRVADLVG